VGWFVGLILCGKKEEIMALGGHKKFCCKAKATSTEKKNVKEDLQMRENPHAKLTPGLSAAGRSFIWMVPRVTVMHTSRGLLPLPHPNSVVCTEDLWCPPT
jgi:hypothetical protein